MFVISLCWSCTNTTQESESPFLGTWTAKWKTLPESYPGVTGVDFTMDGVVKFYPDSASILAYGYQGCIFSEDTLSHSLQWKLSNDSLHLVNDNDVYGMMYKVVAQEENKIELMLMEDIFLTLTR